MDKNREVNAVINVDKNSDNFGNLLVSTCYTEGNLGKGYYLRLIPCEYTDYGGLRMNLSAQLRGGDIRQCGMRILWKRAPRYSEKVLQTIADNVKNNVVPKLPKLWNEGDAHGIINLLIRL